MYLKNRFRRDWSICSFRMAERRVFAMNGEGNETKTKTGVRRPRPEDTVDEADKEGGEDIEGKAPAAKRRPIADTERWALESGPAARRWLYDRGTVDELTLFLCRHRVQTNFRGRKWLGDKHTLVTTVRASAPAVDDDDVVSFVRGVLRVRQRVADERLQSRLAYRDNVRREQRNTARFCRELRTATVLLREAHEMVMYRGPEMFLAVRLGEDARGVSLALLPSFFHRVEGKRLEGLMKPAPTFTPRRDMIFSEGGAHLRLAAGEWRTRFLPAEPSLSDEGDPQPDGYRAPEWRAENPPMVTERVQILAHIAASLVWQQLGPTAIPFDVALIVFRYAFVERPIPA
jgi:hypothetical protein